MEVHNSKAAKFAWAIPTVDGIRGIGLLLLSQIALTSEVHAAAPTAPNSVPDALSVEWKGKHPCEALYEDTQIRVARCTFPPGAVHLRHSHPGYLTYILNGGKGLTRNEAGERAGTNETGALLQNKPVPWHQYKNVGDTTMSYLLVEKKYEPAPAAVVSATAGSPQSEPADTAGFVTISPAAIVWKDIPNGHGAQTAVLVGNPSKPGVYVARTRFPPHVMDTPQSHSGERYVTVLEGTWTAGTGPKFDPATARLLQPGSVMVHPAGGVHWDGSSNDAPVVVQIVGIGPVTTTTLDPNGPDWVDVRTPTAR